MNALFFNHDRMKLIKLIEAPGSEPALEIIRAADQVRAASVGEEVHLRGLIEISSFCRRNCLYCGLRRDNRKLTRYRLAPEEIIGAAEYGAKLGYKTVVLQSGEDLAFTAEQMAEIIQEIKKYNLVVTLSLGERHPEEYYLWRKAGAERYLMRHETAAPELYRKLHPGQSYEQRISLLKILKSLDYQVGTGFIVGLPGQTPETLLADLALLRELNPEMAGIGPFIPHPATPLGDCPGGALQLTLLMVALARLILPRALIPATTALGSIDPLGREAALQAGANVLMPNLTPSIYRPRYEIYPNKICLTETAGDCRNCTLKRIESLGRRVAAHPGHQVDWSRRRPHEDVGTVH
jgi:biotin synthase